MNPEKPYSVLPTQEAWYFLAAIVASSEDSIVTIDFNGIITTWNAAAERLYGYPAEEAIGKSLSTLTLPNDLRLVPDNIVKIRNGEVTAVFDTIHVRKDMQEMNLKVAMSPVKNDKGELIGVSAIARDITRRKQAEISLTGVAARDRFLVELSDALRPLSDPRQIQWAAISLLGERLKVDRTLYAEIESDDEHFFIADNYVRGTFPKMTGRFSLTDFGKTPDSQRAGETLVLPDIAAAGEANEHLAAYLAAGVQSIIGVPLNKAGRWVASLTIHHGSPRAWKDEEVALVSETAERTWAAVERARAEKALRDSEERLRAFITISSDVVYSMSADWTEMHWLKGGDFIARTERPSKTWLEQYIYPEDQQYVHDAINKAIHNKQMFELEHRVLRADGTPGWTSSRAIPLMDESGEITEWFGTADDITEQKQGEEQLQAAHARTTEILNSIGDVFYALDKDFRYTYANRRAEETWGRKREEVLGKTMWEVFPQVKGSESERMHLKAMETREVVHYETISPIIHRWISVGIYPAVNGGLSVYFHEIEDRKRVEEAIRRSEQRARVLADAIPHIIWTNQPDGIASYFNRRWFDYTGLAFEDSVGLGWEAVVHPEDAALSKSRWQESQKQAVVFDTEYRLRRHDGDYRWFIGRNVPLKDEGGNITGWFGSATDIHDMKLAQEALRESEERLRVTMESATDYAIITTDTENIIQGWSLGAERIFGYREEEVKGQNLELTFTPEDVGAGIPLLELQIAREEGRAPDERWHMRRDGTRFFMNGIMAPIYNPSLSGYVKVARDMTEEKEAQERLRVWEERYRIALQSAGMGAWDWNIMEGTIAWNEQHHALLGLAPDDEVKSFDYFMEFIHPHDMPRLRESIGRALDGSGIYHADFRIIRADNGEECWMNGFGRVIDQQDGRPTRMAGVMYDISERKRMDRQKDEFIGIASHELKTPVTSIKAYAEVLEEMFAEVGDQQSAGLMHKMDKQVDRLMELIGTLLDVTRISQGRLELRKSRFELGALVHEVAESFQHATRHQLIIDMARKCTVHADRDRIAQVVTNLLSNAIKYSPEADRVLISISCKNEDEVMVCVQDFGIGMTEEVRAKAFERFYRASDAASQTYPGMGLGLYISAEIIRQHGGKIWADSTPGKGSALCFTLPVNGA